VTSPCIPFSGKCPVFRPPTRQSSHFSLCRKCGLGFFCQLSHHTPFTIQQPLTLTKRSSRSLRTSSFQTCPIPLNNSSNRLQTKANPFSCFFFFTVLARQPPIVRVPYSPHYLFFYALSFGAQSQGSGRHAADKSFFFCKTFFHPFLRWIYVPRQAPLAALVKQVVYGASSLQSSLKYSVPDLRNTGFEFFFPANFPLRAALALWLRGLHAIKVFFSYPERDGSFVQPSCYLWKGRL